MTVTEQRQKPAMGSWFNVGGEIQYYPLSDNPLWNQEVESVLQYTIGRGLDVGCGLRRLRPDNMVFLDKYEEARPDVIADPSEGLPFDDNEFDFVFSSHCIEHQVDWKKALSEMIRVVKDNGYVCLIVPDREYTSGLDPDHKVEWAHSEFLSEDFIVSNLFNIAPIIDTGEAGRNWSFYVVFQKGAFAGRKPVPFNVNRAPLALDLIKVICYGDDPRATTGFGTVARALYERLNKNGILVRALGKYSPYNAVQPGEVPYFLETTCYHDPDGIQDFHRWLRSEKFDAIFINADPGFVFQALQATKMFSDAPVVSYFPVEGVPVAPSFINLVTTIEGPITYCRFGADELNSRYMASIAGKDDVSADLKNKVIKYAYHGVDHAPFTKYSDDKRNVLRRNVGFDESFVVMNVSRNKRTNVQASYIEAAAILKSQGYDDIVFYLHCKPYEAFILDGWHLIQIVENMEYKYGVDLECNVIMPNLEDQTRGIPFYTNTDYGKVENKSKNMRAALFERYTLIDRYNVADLYIDYSQVQGFCLPNMEAAACGLPILSINDWATRSEILGSVAVELTEPDYYEYWQNCGKLVACNAETIASRIAYYYEHRDALAAHSEMSLNHAKLFKWDDAAKTIIDEIKRLTGRG